MGEARLVLTEALIRAALRREKAALKERETTAGTRRKRRQTETGREARSEIERRKAAARGAAQSRSGPHEGDDDGR